MSEYKNYLVSYRYDGGQWNIELPALSEADARNRLSQLCFGQVEGEVFARVPSAMGPLASIIVAARNLLRAIWR